MHTFTSLVPVAVLVAVHLTAGRAVFDIVRHPNWLSFAGGAGAAYVFIHLLPVLNELSSLSTIVDGVWQDGEWIFVSALAGTCAFHAVDVSSRRSIKVDEPSTLSRTFWISTVSFALYNGLVGATFVLKPYSNALDALIYHAALVLHFTAVDQTIRARDADAYDDVGRWIMAAAVPIGWLFAQLGLGDPFVASVVFAFLAGGMILNVIAHEIAETRRRTLVPFLAGCGLFGIVFLVARSI